MLSLPHLTTICICGQEKKQMLDAFHIQPKTASILIVQHHNVYNMMFFSILFIMDFKEDNGLEI